MKSMYSRAVLIALLLPAASLAWAGDVDPPKTEATAEAAVSADAQVEAKVDANANAETKVETKVEANAETAAPAAAAQGAMIGAPQPGKGQIVFFRPAKFAGAMIGFKVREGETVLGQLNPGKYFVASVEPGAHQYTVHSEAKDVVNLEVEAGETLYVQGTITMGLMVGRPNLAPSTQAEFDAVAKKLKLAEAKK
ncbi:DUF2846 domain-containing protein [Lysobacter capsici]|uniref:DUF2846 domain-containing protein n=1 Tax=Lysobacter capsici TaxID=435897 RepID=UPI000BBB15E1|nr:DUF2846 domain-containing protein [Lysobacter capsici]ATE72766.1 hypothetical protein CNO08_16265 [Lysobacter capsici]